MTGYRGKKLESLRTTAPQLGSYHSLPGIQQRSFTVPLTRGRYLRRRRRNTGARTMSPAPRNASELGSGVAAELAVSI